MQTETLFKIVFGVWVVLFLGAIDGSICRCIYNGCRRVPLNGCLAGFGMGKIDNFPSEKDRIRGEAAQFGRHLPGLAEYKKFHFPPSGFWGISEYPNLS